jgi:hypothetical protein
MVNLCIFVFSFALFSIRNIDPAINPILFAEDGTWTAAMLKNGFFETSFESRTFPIFGLIFLYKIGYLIADAISPASILYLPLVYWVVSNLFMASIVLVAYVNLKNYLSNYSVAAIIFSIWLLPVGGDGNEIFGRILNLGFFLPYMQVISIIPILRGSKKKFDIGFALFVFVFSGLTLPVGIALSYWASVILIVRYLLSAQRVYLYYSLAFLFVALASSCLINFGALNDKGGADLPFKSEAFTEFAIARSILYIVIFWIYNKLNDLIVWLIFIFFCVIIIKSVPFSRRIFVNRFSNDKDILCVVIFFFGAAIIYWLALIFMRSGLSSLFNNYEGTWPDRYFTGINLIFFASFVIIFNESYFLKFFTSVLIIFLLIVFVKRFEFDEPVFKMNGADVWPIEVCRSLHNPYKYNNIDIKISPDHWVANFPIPMNEKMARERCGGSMYYNFSILKYFGVPIYHQNWRVRNGDDLKVSSVQKNNSVYLSRIDLNEVEVLVNGLDPSVVFNFYDRADHNYIDVERVFHFSMKSEEGEIIQIYYNKDSDYKEADSLKIKTNLLSNQSAIVFRHGIWQNLRMDFPEGRGRYRLIFDSPVSID